jgi:hypothetical protein
MLCELRLARLAISYTGSPVNFPEGKEIIGIEDWLFREIGNSPPGIQPGQFMYELTNKLSVAYERATTHFKTHPNKRKLSVVFAGFDLETKQPMLICISNFENLGTLLLGGQDKEKTLHRLAPSKTFNFKVGSFTTTITHYSGKGTRVMAHGNISVLDTGVINSMHRKLRNIEEKGLGHLALRDILVNAIRQAVLQRGDGTISKSCLSISLYRDNPIAESGQHSLTSDEWIMPRVVGPGMQVEVWLYADNINKRKIEAVDYLDEINADTLRAYIETSEEAKYWMYYHGTSETRLAFWGELQRGVALIRDCGLRLIGDIQGLLNSSHGWGETFLTNYYKQLAGEGHSNSTELNLTLHAPILFLIAAANVQKISAEKLEKVFPLHKQFLDIALQIRHFRSKEEQS